MTAYFSEVYGGGYCTNAVADYSRCSQPLTDNGSQSRGQNGSHVAMYAPLTNRSPLVDNEYFLTTTAAFDTVVGVS